MPSPARYRRLTVVRRLIEAVWRDRGQFSRAKIPRTCPMCGYSGTFISVGRPSRWDARCAGCGSRERHRLTHLWAVADGGDRFAGKRILHFAPERAVIQQMRGNRLYDTADLHQADVTHRVDITGTNLFSDTYDVIIAHHVLEHIDADRQAMAEIHRLLRAGGVAILSVPVNGTRDATYENPAITAKAERFVQTSLREWAYAQAYPTSDHRAAELIPWLHRYNWHRPHGGIKLQTPISRLGLTEDNLLSIHT